MSFVIYDSDTESYLKRFNVYTDKLLYMSIDATEALTFESEEAAIEHMHLLKAFHIKHNKYWMVEPFQVINITEIKLNIFSHD